MSSSLADDADGGAISPDRLSPLAWLLVRLIGWYQRYLSPYKGFRCAHRALHGGESCSQFVKRAVRQRGAMRSLSAARGRFAECRAARDSLICGAELQSAEFSGADLPSAKIAAGDPESNDGQNPPTAASAPSRWSALDCCHFAPDACEAATCCGDVPGVDCCPW